MKKKPITSLYHAAKRRLFQAVRERCAMKPIVLRSHSDRATLMPGVKVAPQPKPPKKRGRK